MASLDLIHRGSIDAFGDTSLKWPNSVAVFDDGRVAVADGGHNRVCVFDYEGRSLWEHSPGAGFSNESLREPIYVGVAPDQSLFVSDWHNHRFLIFDAALKFSHTLFHMGPLKKRSFIYCLELFLKHLMTQAVGAPYYFSFDKMGGEDNKKADYSVAMLLKGVGYYLGNPKDALEVFNDVEMAVRKANGIVFRDDSFVITQKANCCVSAYRFSGDGFHDVRLIKHVFEHDGKPFGRLCNLAQGDDGRIYVCDQNNWRIAVLDKDLTAVDTIHFEERDDIPMAPFSCAVIGNRYLAAARSFGIEVKALDTHETVYANNDMGETHGIAWDPNRSFLYYVDRSNSKIERFEVKGL